MIRPYCWKKQTKTNFDHRVQELKVELTRKLSPLADFHGTENYVVAGGEKFSEALAISEPCELQEQLVWQNMTTGTTVA